MGGFVYPNEGEVQWSLLIVVYPYLTGLLAGAWLIPSLYYVFGLRVMRPVARLSLLVGLSFLLVAPVPLQAHLGRPERAFEIFLTPHFTSAMAGFGYIWLISVLVLTGETWLAFRPDIVRYAQETRGPLRPLFWALALGSMDVSEKALATDQRVIKVLALIGIPMAFGMHGYVGFLFAGIKANPWWSTPLMPIIFTMSSVVSGTALLTIVYIVIARVERAPVDHECLRGLAGWLFGFYAVDVALEGLEILSEAYRGEDSWPVIWELITRHIAVSFVGIQLLLGSLLPLAILAWVLITHPRWDGFIRAMIYASALTLLGVFAMRWNIVIGGQLLSKSMRGFLEYIPPIGGREGVAAAALIMMLPFYVFSALVFLLPPFGRPEEAAPAPEPAAIPEAYGSSYGGGA